jgi:hypothetical protein
LFSPAFSVFPVVQIVRLTMGATVYGVMSVLECFVLLTLVSALQIGAAAVSDAFSQSLLVRLFSLFMATPHCIAPTVVHCTACSHTFLVSLSLSLSLAIPAVLVHRASARSACTASSSRR